MAKDWIMVRLPRALALRLRNLAERVDMARVRGHHALQDLEGEPTLHAMIARLVDQYDRHADRRATSARRTKARRGYLATATIREWYRG